LKYDFAQELTLVQDGKTNRVPVLTLSGLDSTLDRQLKISGTTSDTNEFITYDVVVIGAEAYIKGVTGVPGVNPAEWYALPEAAQAGVRRLPSARGLIASFSPEDVGKARFQSMGSETLDELTCTVWSAQNPTFAQSLLGMAEESELRKQMAEISRTELKLWTCADGYIHRMTGEVQGPSEQNAADSVTLTLRFELSNFNEALKIEPPPDVNPFPTTPPQGQATQAPEATIAVTPVVTATPATESAPSPSPTP
jgi:hypothetical protein